MERNWTTVGEELGSDPEFAERAGEFSRERLAKLFETLKWESVEGDKPMLPGLAIKEAIVELQIPKVSRIAISHELAPYGLYGIEGHYKNGRALVYLVDKGTVLLPVCSDFFPAQEVQVLTKHLHELEYVLDERDQEILQERMEALEQSHDIHQGDYVHFADGAELRIAHVWPDKVQMQHVWPAETGYYGSWHLGKGHVSYSGSLTGGPSIDSLRLTNERKLGSCWFFHHDRATAHNGVDVMIPFRVYETDEETP